MIDEVGKMRMRRFAHELEHAHWVLDPGQPDGLNAVGFWLYSYSLMTGPRLVGQLTIEGYRAMRSGKLMAEIGDSGSAVDLLGATLNCYDEIREEQRTKASSDLVVSALAAYAGMTKTLEALPGIDARRNQHFMVFDWITSNSTRIFRPAATVGEALLTPETLRGFAQAVLASHLARRPDEAPMARSSKG